MGIEATSAGIAGTHLEPFLRGFQECGFRQDFDQFVLRHAPAFAACCPDSSHPLRWTEIHQEYRKLFDTQLETILEYHCARSIERDEFVAYCSGLAGCAKDMEVDAVLPDTGGALVRDFNSFLTSLTMSEDYEAFLRVMLSAAPQKDAIVATS